MTPSGFGRLFNSPIMEMIEHLDVSWAHITNDTFNVLTNNPNIKKLREIILFNISLVSTESLNDFLLRAEAAKNLEVLDLSMTRADASTLGIIAERVLKGESKLKELDL